MEATFRLLKIELLPDYINLQFARSFEAVDELFPIYYSCQQAVQNAAEVPGQSHCGAGPTRVFRPPNTVTTLLQKPFLERLKSSSKSSSTRFIDDSMSLTLENYWTDIRTRASVEEADNVQEIYSFEIEFCGGRKNGHTPSSTTKQQ